MQTRLQYRLRGSLHHKRGVNTHCPEQQARWVVLFAWRRLVYLVSESFKSSSLSTMQVLCCGSELFQVTDAWVQVLGKPTTLFSHSPVVLSTTSSCNAVGG